MCPGVVLKEISPLPLSPGVYRHAPGQSQKGNSSRAQFPKGFQGFRVPLAALLPTSTRKKEPPWAEASSPWMCRNPLTEASTGRCPAATRKGGPSSRFLEVGVTGSHLAPEESALADSGKKANNTAGGEDRNSCVTTAPLGHSLGSMNIS